MEQVARAKEEKRKEGERQWEYLQQHPLRKLEYFILLRAEVGRAWFDEVLDGSRLSSSREEPGVTFSSLVASRTSGPTAKASGANEGAFYWRAYAREKGYWYAKRPVDAEGLVAGVSGEVDWTSLALKNVETIRDLSRLSEVGISLAPNAFKAGVEECEVTLRGDTFSFTIRLSEHGLEFLHEMAHPQHNVMGEKSRIPIGVTFSGAQLLDIFFKQWISRWEGLPSAGARRGTLGLSGPNGREIRFFPTMPPSFRGSPDEQEYTFTVRVPKTVPDGRTAELEKTVKAGTKDAAVLVELVARYGAQGRLTDALGLLGRARDEGVNSRDVQRIWGQVLGGLGRHAEAVEHWRGRGQGG